ncbi:MAG: tyrosine-type recombinase/integrase [Ardenticatenaceae bacterium]|nr:tyrosine-type recombinase/integrase [Ardenticatenaceae bacterium]
MSTAIVPSSRQPLDKPTPDATLIRLWLHGRSPRTPRAYRADAERFLAFVEKPLAQVTLADLQAFADSLTALAPASQARTLSAIKSLFTFAHKTGYLPVNVGAALRLPKRKETLGERILSESAVQRMLALEPKARNHAILRLLYGGGLRVAELVSLCWRDCQARTDAGQVVVFGKGGKTRAVLLSKETWAKLMTLRDPDAGLDDPVFVSQKGGALSPSAVWRIVRAAARRAGIDRPVSPHWLRHAFASHALDRGAPISLVQHDLGHANMATTGKYTHARPNDGASRYLSV